MRETLFAQALEGAPFGVGNDRAIVWSHFAISHSTTRRVFCSIQSPNKCQASQHLSFTQVEVPLFEKHCNTLVQVPVPIFVIVECTQGVVK